MLVRLCDLDEYGDAVPQKQKLASLFTDFIRKPLTIEEENTQQEKFAAMERALAKVELGNDSQARRVIEEWIESETEASNLVLEPGFINELPGCFEINFTNPTDAGVQYLRVVLQQITMIAASLG